MSYTYSIAISFLSQDEDLARRLHHRLQQGSLLPVFLYPERQRDLTGKSFEDALAPVFETQSRIVVVLHRPGWGKAGGTLVEYRAINRRRLRGDESFLFLIAAELSQSERPPWHEDLLYHDLSRYGIDDAVTAIARMVREHERDHASPVGDPPPIPSPPPRPIVTKFAERLRNQFTATPGVYQGHFGGLESAADAARWASKGGETVTSPLVPKLPYYHTYWGYEAALRLAPDDARTWAPITLEAITRHFGTGRWLRVVPEYSFTSGPRGDPDLAESIRHTARAAELTYLLEPAHRRVSEVAWDLLHAAGAFQHHDGGWSEFRNRPGPPALWSTLYVHRFLSKLVQDRSRPDEREAFQLEAKTTLIESEKFLAAHWRQHRWALSDQLLWDEGTSAVLAEIGPYVSDDALIHEAYYTLRSALTPAGRLRDLPDIPGRPPETVLTLRMAFGLKSCGRNLADSDSRYQRLRGWLLQSLDPNQLTTYDIAFASLVFALETEPSDGRSSMDERPDS